MSERMSISNVTSGKTKEPYRLVIHGKMGVGKSVFATSAPDPIVMDVENSTSEIDTSRFPRPTTFQDVLDGINSLLTSTHNFKTFVLDTVDATEQLIWDHVIAQARKETKYATITTLEEVGGGYGKGAAAALMQWRILLGAMDALFEKKGMNVIVLGHSAVKKFKSADIAVEPFDRYELKLLPSAAALISEWPKALMFADYEILSTEKDKRVYGISTGKRILHTTHSAAWDAKNRYGLPEPLPLDWAEFDKRARSGMATQKTDLVAQIEALKAAASPEVAKQIEAGITKANGDADKLAMLINWASTKVNK